MIIDAVTESGRTYRIDLVNGIWCRISKSGYRESTENIWSIKTGTVLCWPWDNPEVWEDANEPEIGKHLYIASREVWYVSTRIEQINEIPSWTFEVDTE